LVRYFTRHFQRRADGIWLCISAAELVTPRGRLKVTPGTCFAPGTSFMGVDIVAWLEAEAKVSPAVSGLKQVFTERRSNSRQNGSASSLLLDRSV
jgi:hypothetical protein